MSKIESILLDPSSGNLKEDLFKTKIKKVALCIKSINSLEIYENENKTRNKSIKEGSTIIKK